MKMICNKFIFWLPRARCILFILFISLFSLDVFSEEYNIRKKFSPTRTGGKSASLNFENNDPYENPSTIGMGGTGPSGWPTAPFHRGLNLLEWFQEPRSGQIHINRYTEEDFKTIRAMGCDAVRVLIDLLHMAGPAPGYELDPLFLEFLDLAVDRAEAAELFIVLDNHTWDPVVNTDPAIEPVLLATWTQMARHFKNRSNLVLYEVLNEPHGISDSVWNAIQGRVIQAIRNEDGFHTIVVGTIWNSYLNLAALPAYPDNNLLYTFHFYTPHLFTHQGTTWGDPVPVDLVGVPFPYNASEMPPLPASLAGTWWEDIYNAYPQQGNETWVKSQLDIAVQFRTNRNVPLWCGEFSAYPPASPSEDRAAWTGLVRSYLEEKGIAWTVCGGFFKINTVGCFETDIDTMITSALGLMPPAQKEPASEPDTSGFTMYDDFIMHGLIESGWFSSGEYDLYSKESPHEGESCLKITGFEQYGNISFRFSPLRDLSFLANRGSALDLWIRCASPGTRIDIRFEDTKTSDPQDHPWRINTTLNSSVVAWDGKWHHLRIPLKNFVESGSWDNNQWYNQQGLFDWKAADRFTIDAQHHSLAGIDIFFDDIRISAPQSNVTFRIAAPPETPSGDTVYLMGSMNFWDPGPGGSGTDGSNHDQPMHKIGPNLWERTLSSEAGTVLEYKYTRGAWGKAEKGPQDQEISNRSLTVPASGVVQLDTVRKWNDIASAVADNAGHSLPVQYSLQQNYPNPFNPSTVIRYTLPHGTDVELTVYNTRGQRMAVLVQGYRDVGEHEVRFEGGSLAAGVYFYRLKTKDFEDMKKLVLLR
jgi:endoglucanase